MKSNIIFKALAFAMLMPALLLTTACSDINNERTDQKDSFTIPVTVKVTYQSDPATRATFNTETHKLSFSSGDKLLVRGNDNSGAGAGQFAGLLEWVSDGTFSGTITTQNPYIGDADALFTAAKANWIGATLFPNDYESYEFLSISGSGYSTSYSMSYNKAIADTKAAAVEQFSLESAKTYSGGFTLKPENAILNFTITDLTDGAKDVTLKDGTRTMFTGSVTPSSGTAAFALGAMIKNYMDVPVNLKNLTLTIDGTDIAISSTSKNLEAGHVYNITRSAAATSLSELKTAINGGTDCSSYIGWEVNSAGAIAKSGISGTKIGYVAYVSTSDVDAGVSGSRILVIANADAGTSILWGSYGTSRDLTADDLNGYSNTNTLQGYGSEAHPAAYAAWNYSAAIPSGGATPAHWFMPTKKQWENMRDVYSGGNLDKRNAMVSAYGIDGNYWSSTEYNNVRAYRFSTNGGLQYYVKNGTSATNVRAVFAY